VHYDSTNIDTNPLWDSTGCYPYALTALSPCIDAGTLVLPDGIILPDHDIAGNPRIWSESIDMGAYEFGPWVGIPITKNTSKSSSALSLNISPNPFDSFTLISYQADEAGVIDIEIFDINGHPVNKVLHAYQPPGKGTIYWHGTGRNQNPLPPGTYIARLQVNGKEKGSIKIIKTK
jgi:hypothetical protein